MSNTITDDALAGAKQIAPFSSFEDDVKQLIAEAKSITVTDESQKSEIKASREYRLKLKSLRCAIEARRKELVEGLNKETKAINTAANTIKGIIEPLEEKLLANEEFVERENVKRIFALNNVRVAELSAYCSDPQNFNAGLMTEEAYTELLTGLKAAHEVRVAEIAKAKAEAEAKAKAESERLAKAEEEAAKLRAEAAEREKALASERADAQRKLDAERVLAEIREKEEREKRQAAESALEAAKKKADDEAAAKRAEEARIAAEKAEAERKAAMAPDREKLLAFADTLAKLPLPELSVSTAGLIPVRTQMEKFIAWIRKEAAKL